MKKSNKIPINILKESFLKDLFEYLNNIPITVLSIIIDKQAALKKNWNDIKIFKETIRLLYYNYLAFLFGKESSNGKIIVESATAEKDVYYLLFHLYGVALALKTIIPETAQKIQDLIKENKKPENPLFLRKDTKRTY